MRVHDKVWHEGKRGSILWVDDLPTGDIAVDFNGVVEDLKESSVWLEESDNEVLWAGDKILISYGDRDTEATLKCFSNDGKRNFIAVLKDGSVTEGNLEDVRTSDV